jgi:DMSO reductase anchor subunit
MPPTPSRLLLAAALGAAATAANWWRLRHHPDQAGWGSVRLELRWFRPWTTARLALVVVAGTVALGAGSSTPAGVAVVVLLAVSEGVGRWLFFVTVVPLNMPGSFWRGTAGSAR